MNNILSDSDMDLVWNNIYNYILPIILDEEPNFTTIKVTSEKRISPSGNTIEFCEVFTISYENEWKLKLQIPQDLYLFSIEDIKNILLEFYPNIEIYPDVKFSKSINKFNSKYFYDLHKIIKIYSTYGANKITDYIYRE